jgi:hypothetical protein
MRRAAHSRSGPGDVPSSRQLPAEEKWARAHFRTLGWCHWRSWLFSETWLQSSLWGTYQLSMGERKVFEDRWRHRMSRRKRVWNFVLGWDAVTSVISTITVNSGYADELSCEICYMEMCSSVFWMVSWVWAMPMSLDGRHAIQRCVHLYSAWYFAFWLRRWA